MLVAAALVVPVIVIEESPRVGEPWTAIAYVLNWLIWIVFAAELVTMLAVVPNRLRWLREHPLELLIVVLTPPFLPSSLQALRVLRLVRLLRLLRLAQVARRMFSLSGLRYAALLAVLTALGGGAAFARIEPGVGTWDGVWWAIVTMTTVGYGDISPADPMSRAIGIIVMLVGIGFIALLTGAVAERFLAPRIEQEAQEASSEAERAIASTEEDLLGELRAIRQRLESVEVALAARRR